MKKIKILSLLFVCLSIFLSACGDDDTPVPVTVKTVLMYLVGDNDISNDIYNNIRYIYHCRVLPSNKNMGKHFTFQAAPTQFRSACRRSIKYLKGMLLA